RTTVQNRRFEVPVPMNFFYTYWEIYTLILNDTQYSFVQIPVYIVIYYHLLNKTSKTGGCDAGN
ncbi:MAG: hypothetical protein LBP23_10240, partial [Treponema sp.]|nr:hypothetical protein [Treponema sp.]